jgi:hypothetical protein
LGRQENKVEEIDEVRGQRWNIIERAGKRQDILREVVGQQKDG